VGEVINGGIRLLGINEGDLRDEDKRGGEDLEEDLIFILVWEFMKYGGGGGGNWKNCFEEISHGIAVARNFGLGARETTRIPGARDPKRLFLVDWEVNV